ncbi:thioredoxin family protein [Spongiimicrobium sp. 3-5]|uniref:thioredoxin family protein n=1 Tax=Spongiimicrobium sp. 3-5 TaxID=3332596 RepID=UPI00398179DB
MKKIFLFCLLPVLLSAQADLKVVEGVNWTTDYAEAMEKAAEEHKNVLLYFTGSDWCPPCKMLKADLFETSNFKDLAKHYVLLYIDMPRNKDLLTSELLAHNKELLSKFNKKGVFPLMKVLNHKGRELGEISGYNMNGYIEPHLNLLQKHCK